MRLWVNDDDLGEDFQVDVPVSQVVAALQEEGGEIVEAVFSDGESVPSIPVTHRGPFLVIAVSEDMT